MIRFTDLPFAEAIAAFRKKAVNLPTDTWRDIEEGMHSRAFVVAQAAKADLLADLRGAVDKAIAQGTTLRDFQRDLQGQGRGHGLRLPHKDHLRHKPFRRLFARQIRADDHENHAFGDALLALPHHGRRPGPAPSSCLERYASSREGPVVEQPLPAERVPLPLLRGKHLGG
jgi:hypothetical protein